MHQERSVDLERRRISKLPDEYILTLKSYVTPTMLALRGKDPVTTHQHHFRLYFLLVISVYYYYLFTGEKRLSAKCIQDETLMDYCLSRRNQNGLVEGLSGDWTFVDWATGLSKKGEVSVERAVIARV